MAPAAVQWLADGRAPQGALCVVAGEPGTCKSLLATDWAARVSNGCEQRDAALIAHAADLPAPILRARLDAAGATIQRVAMATLPGRNRATTPRWRNLTAASPPWPAALTKETTPG